MESASQTVEVPAPGLTAGTRRRPWLGDWPGQAQLAYERIRFAFLVYLGSRVLLVAVAIVNGALRHHALLNEVAHWDGLWYRSIANFGGAYGGYPHHVIHAPTNLGFFPLYPLVAWFFSHPVQWITGYGVIRSITIAGVLVSTVGGLVATVLVERLASGWWGPRAARRAVLLFCLFPGSVVFTMVYAEGIMLPLAAGCLLALERRRWLLAGALAGLATATEPEALVLVLVCAAAAIRDVHRSHGLRAAIGGRELLTHRSLLAPLLSLTGAVGFASFLWAWTGTPVATFATQRYGWNERTDPFALVHLVTRLASQISFTHFDHPTINLNLVVGLAGAIVLLGGLVLLVRSDRRISLEAGVWTLGIALLTVTAEYTPPNPRLLITAFPAVLVFAERLRGRGFAGLAVANGVLLAGLSALTFVHVTLRP